MYSIVQEIGNARPNVWHFDDLEGCWEFLHTHDVYWSWIRCPDGTRIYRD